MSPAALIEVSSAGRGRQYNFTKISLLEWSAGDKTFKLTPDYVNDGKISLKNSRLIFVRKEWKNWTWFLIDVLCMEIFQTFPSPSASASRIISSISSSLSISPSVDITERSSSLEMYLLKENSVLCDIWQNEQNLLSIEHSRDTWINVQSNCNWCKNGINEVQNSINKAKSLPISVLVENFESSFYIIHGIFIFLHFPPHHIEKLLKLNTS